LYLLISMSANLLGTDVEGVLGRVLEADPECLYVVNPSAAVLEQLVYATVGSAGPEIRVLGEEETLKRVMEDFLVASKAADLVEADRVAIRSVPENGRTAMFLTDDQVTALVQAGDQVGGLSTTDRNFTSSVLEAVETEWDAAEAFRLRTPALSRITETLELDLEPCVREDFESLLGALETARGNGTGLDEVTISLLVAAKNNVLLYDISKWGEDVGIASKATFSRTKTKLEDKGLIDTEKVPIDVGRPRLRLKLQDERLLDADPAEMAAIASEVLAN
jgi:hypothetical protein